MKVTVNLSHRKGSGPDLETLTSKRVYVGIPQRAAKRQEVEAKTPLSRIKQVFGEEINNAQLLYIHTNGSPMHNIPPRPVIEPALRADGNRERISKELKQAAKSALDGDANTAEKFLNRAGFAGENAAKGWFVDNRNGWAPNRPATIKRKGSSRPLIDTGALRASITHVIGKV